MKITPLTPRETEVAKLVAEGHGNRIIADKLCISNNSIRKHLSSAYDKLGLDTDRSAICHRVLLTRYVLDKEEERNEGA